MEIINKKQHIPDRHTLYPLVMFTHTVTLVRVYPGCILCQTKYFDFFFRTTLNKNVEIGLFENTIKHILFLYFCQDLCMYVACTSM